MFNKVQQFNELRKMRSQAMELQKKLKEIKESREERDSKVVVTGDRSIDYLVVDGIERADLVKLINKALEEVQKKAAKKMMEESGGLSGLLKGF
jgi:DNA-binding protein YbaB